MADTRTAGAAAACKVASDWLIANVGTVKHDTGASARKHVKEGK